MNKNILKTAGKDAYEVEYGYVNSIKINGIDEWFKVKIITEPRMFDSYCSDSSKLYFVENITEQAKLNTLEEINRIFLQGKPKHYHMHLKDAIAKDYEKLELRLEPNFKSKRLYSVKNKMYFKWFEPQADKLFQNYINNVKQDWGVTGIELGSKNY